MMSCEQVRMVTSWEVWSVIGECSDWVHDTGVKGVELCVLVFVSRVGRGYRNVGGVGQELDVFEVLDVVLVASEF